MVDRVVWLSELTRSDVSWVGGKNASLGEMIQYLTGSGIRVPEGFATTADAYWEFLDANVMRDQIAGHIDRLHKGAELGEVGQAIREIFLAAELPRALVQEIGDAYHELAVRLGRTDPEVAVRSSATAEDLPQASFAGQQETFLNVSGIDALADACRRCYASLFTDRAISYRENNEFDHLTVALSVGVQHMVRSDLAGAGVMFSIDTESGFPDSVLINASWGLGETVVSGRVDPDEYVVFKPLLDCDGLRPIVSKTRGRKECKTVYGAVGTRMVETSDAERLGQALNDTEILALARWAVLIEDHYGTAMDMEWAKDGRSGELFLVQARPETVQARREAATLLRSLTLVVFI